MNIVNMKLGFTSYKTLYYNSNCNIEIINNGLSSIVKIIDDNKVYVVIIEVGSKGSYYTLTKVLFISDSESVEKAMEIVKTHYETLLLKYRMDSDKNLSVIIKGREYLSEQEYSSMKDKNFKSKVMKQLDKIQNDINIKSSSNSDSIEILVGKYIAMSKRTSNGFSLDTPLYLHNKIDKINNEFINREDFIDNKMVNTEGYNNSIKYTIKVNGVVKISWIDHNYSISDENIIKRVYKDDVYIFINGELKDLIIHYKFPNLRKISKDKEMNKKIGTIDIETYKDENGNSIPYACGYKVNDTIKTFYIKENDEFNKVVIQMMEELVSKYSDYTFLVHNLDFDGIYLLNSIIHVINDVQKVNVVMKDNKFISIKYKDLKIIDSYKFIPISLDKALKDFNIGYNKTPFPYDFITKYTLDYVGVKPSIEFYNKDIDYQSLPQEFNTKENTLKYLENDLKSLYALIEKFNDIVFNKYHVDFTKCNSISSLSFKIYIINYYKTKYNIKVFKDTIDIDIRSAHYGGVVDLNSNTIINGFYYDMNSQYPSAMRNKMPVGNPTLMTNMDLNNAFGFYYATILVPSNTKSFIPHKTVFGTIEYPNTQFSGWYFSEELKAVKNLGYKIQLHGGYQFESSPDVFKDFVENLYYDRLQQKENSNSSLSNIIKLIMNSLYGKTGMNPITTQCKIISKNQFKDFDKKYTILNSFVLPKDNILILINNTPNISLLELFDKTIDTSINTPKSSKIVQTSIPLAASIASYARISMYPFKTIDNNSWAYTDTDSIILQNELNPKLVSNTNLGMMKLEIKIKQGIFLAPKFYALLLENDTVVIKSAGLSSCLLTLQDFIDILNGVEKVIYTKQFVKNYNDNMVQIKDHPITLKMNDQYKIDHNTNYHNQDLISPLFIFLPPLPYFLIYNNVLIF